MAKTSVKIKIDNRSIYEIERKTLLGMFDMATDIETQAKINAPYLTGALSNSIRTVKLSDNSGIEVIAGGVVGGKNINYAYYREVMPNRKNPSSEHYMENAMKQIMTGDYMKKYFGGISK